MRVEVVTKEDYKGRKSEVLVVQVGSRRTMIKISSILYVMSQMRKVVIVEKDTTTEAYGKLAELEKCLKQYGFYRCHQSFLINEAHIRGCANKEILLDNEETVPISRSHWYETRSYFTETAEE